jgi:hypothetical protein
MRNVLPVARKDNVVIQEADGDVLIYDLKENKAFCLNQTAAAVWQLCNGGRDVTEIAKQLAPETGGSANEDLVWLALDQLKRENLIERNFEGIFDGMSRRAVIRKIGLSSMVALPVVASLLAPAAVSAASCTLSNVMLSCTMDAQCCDNGLCVGGPMFCACVCVNPGDCITQTSCPSTVNCNAMGQCAP